MSRSVFRGAGGRWYHVTEDDDSCGPFDTAEAAELALAQYTQRLNVGYSGPVFTSHSVTLDLNDPATAVALCAYATTTTGKLSEVLLNQALRIDKATGTQSRTVLVLSEDPLTHFYQIDILRSALHQAKQHLQAIIRGEESGYDGGAVERMLRHE